MLRTDLCLSRCSLCVCVCVCVFVTPGLVCAMSQVDREKDCFFISIFLLLSELWAKGPHTGNFMPVCAGPTMWNKL